ncbi:GGDEF domain-containing protein [Massilia forsythiae]|uniref:diguanylate cyclase n=1 Tax=Massilia forsythiae TaxID=2728020 RepID=A0A7Z2ZUG7_9BURK|nr:GGDEF domain-containing protein [Massilia forsythiae]QJE02666.1 GGDEF domain-containing protein [Massilia forsythiae]
MSVLSLFVLNGALAAIMLMVLRSLSHAGAAGVREWSLANGMAVVALPLFIGRGVIPDVLSLELANALLLGASMMVYAGFRRHLGLPVPARALACGLAATIGLLSLLYRVVDVLPVRIALASSAHGIVFLALAHTLHRMERRDETVYPRRFAFWVAVTMVCIHAARAAAYLVRYDPDAGIFDASLLNMACITLGTLAMPALTLGAVMMANADIIRRTTYAAEHDHLTGAWSRRAFFGIAERERERVERRGGALSVLVFDVDHFKSINDTRGHAAGDRVLADIVMRTEAVLRGRAVCARLGGEEFAVLLPDTGASGAGAMAEHLRAVLEQAVLADEGQDPLRYTVSVGVACLAPQETLAALLERTDAALYAAKRGGRNRVCEAQAAQADSWSLNTG